jgi:hypothetical protein
LNHYPQTIWIQARKSGSGSGIAATLPEGCSSIAAVLRRSVLPDNQHCSVAFRCAILALSGGPLTKKWSD